jgi:hypothetical protein
MVLPVDRTTLNTPSEHVSDHDTLHGFYNTHPTDPAAHSGYVSYAPAPNGTDDTSALQAYLTACPAGGDVILQRGIYKTSNRLVIPPGVSLLGPQGRRVNNLALATEVPTLSYIKPQAGFSGDACLRILDKEEGSYSADNNGQRIMHVALDLSAVGGSTVDGIKATGYVHDVMLVNVSIYGAPHNGVTASSYTRADTSSWHPYSWTVINCIAQACGNIGWSLGNATDTWMELVEAIGCGSHGFFLASMANSHFIGLRAEFCLDGYRITGGWGTGTGSGGGVWVGCTTDRNTNYGFHVDATGSSPLNFVGPVMRRDGRNGGSGGGNYAGFFGDNSTCPISISTPNVYPGVDDNGSGTNSPQIGIKASGCTFFSFGGSGYIHAATTPISDDGTNTAFMRGPGIGTATGSTASPTRATAIGWAAAYTQADRQAITLVNSGTQTNSPLIDVEGVSVGSRWISTKVTGEANRRFNQTMDGKQEWGGGTGSRDTNLYRSAAGILKTDNTLVVATPGTATGSAVTTDGTQTLTSKTIAGASNTLYLFKTGLAKINGGAQQWGAPGTLFTSQGTTALVINEDRYVPLFIPYAVTLTAWQLEVTTGPASAANLSIGIYPADTDMQPVAATAPLYDSGSVAVANGFTGIKTATGLTIALTPGAYLVAINCDVTMTLRTFISGSPIIGAALGATPMVQRVSVARTYNPFPTPGNKWTATNVSAAGLQNFVVWQWTE